MNGAFSLPRHKSPFLSNFFWNFKSRRRAQSPSIDREDLENLCLSMGRSPCCSKEGLNRGAWTALEDKILADYIKIHGEGKWRNLPKKSGLKRCGKSCRLRWLNYLRPDIKRGNITPDEEELIIRLHKLLGNRWSLIAGRLPGRTDNEIKNYWNTNLGKRSITLSLKQLSNSIDKKKLPSPPSSSKMESPVLVRTKALRCTKVILPPQQLDTPAQGPALTGDVCHNHIFYWILNCCNSAILIVGMVVQPPLYTTEFFRRLLIQIFGMKTLSYELITRRIIEGWRKR
ncbi:hypothetical protein NE237_024649 [Protea cynaroides]|uniref:Uncharacterized protein n=1 Tax=Protea cynaroides TaxID=273540 RepID=A0A9Q0H0Z1_9MAGN|nr:hypothetical protein NE237_024649 [Protea cynaroides]